MSKEINHEVKNIIEAALMVANQPVSVDKLAALFPEASGQLAGQLGPTKEEIKEVLEVLTEEYKDRGIELKKIDKRYRLQSKTDYAEWLARLTEDKPPRYSRAALETLAIIAYRQPVTRGDIEDIRGVTVSSDIIRSLLEREWIRQVGTRDVPGKPSLYGTTREFLEYFNLSGLNELPTLAELRDLDEIGRELNLSLDLAPDQNAAENTQASGDQMEDEQDDIRTASETNSSDNENLEKVIHQIEAKPSQPDR